MRSAYDGPATLRLVLADDHEMVCEGLRTVLTSVFGKVGIRWGQAASIKVAEPLVARWIHMSC